jgi:hypothetical protein
MRSILRVLLGVSCLAASLPVWADSLDGYDRWRRECIDICQRLPTLDEQACIASAGGYPSVSDGSVCDFANTLDGCLQSEAFAELVALDIDDFILPSEQPSAGQYAWIKWDTATYLDDGGVEQSLRYFYMSSNNTTWSNCLEGAGTFASKADLEAELDEAIEPYFANAYQNTEDVGVYTNDDGDLFVYVCQETQTNDAGVTLTSSLANEDPDAGGLTCEASNRNFPCGCGPNMRWCLLQSSLRDVDGTPTATPNNRARGWLQQQVRGEAAEFAKQVVLRENGILGAVPFTDLLGADYGVRTSRLQHFYEVNQRGLHIPGESDACDRIISGIDKSGEGCTDTMTGSMPFIDTTTDTASYGVDENGADWQVVDFTALGSDGTARLGHYGGILTSWELLVRQPTEPNFANRVYSYWTCEDISWRSWSLAAGGGASYDTATTWSVTDTRGTHDFSTLFRTTAALDPFNSADANAVANCKGCHLTVNPLAAFRNFWDHRGRYRPTRYTDLAADGVFLGQTGSDIVGLGAIMAESPEVHACIVNRVVKRLTGRFLPRTDATLGDLVTTFETSGRDIREVYRAVLDLDVYRRPR